MEPSIETLRDRALAWVEENAAHNSLGIYPWAVHGEGGYEKRSEWQEGWNACNMRHTNNAVTVSSYLDTLDEGIKWTVENLLITEQLRIAVQEDGSAYLYILCNDVFFWACADLEEVPLAEIPDLIECYKQTPDYGDILWICKKRKLRPQNPFREVMSQFTRDLIDACGPERKNGDDD